MKREIGESCLRRGDEVAYKRSRIDDENAQENGIVLWLQDDEYHRTYAHRNKHVVKHSRTNLV